MENIKLINVLDAVYGTIDSKSSWFYTVITGDSSVSDSTIKRHRDEAIQDIKDFILTKDVIGIEISIYKDGRATVEIELDENVLNIGTIHKEASGELEAIVEATNELLQVILSNHNIIIHPARY